MWNWREFYQLADQIRKCTRVLCGGESVVRVASEGTFLLHTISGIYQRETARISFSGHDPEKITAARLVCIYLKKLPENGEVLFNTVFLRYGGNIAPDIQHKIRMVYRRMAEDQSMENFFLDGRFKRLVVLSQKETEIRKTTITELLGVFAMAADEQGMLLLSEQNARLLCHGLADGREQENVAQM